MSEHTCLYHLWLQIVSKYTTKLGNLNVHLTFRATQKGCCILLRDRERIVTLSALVTLKKLYLSAT